MANTEERDASLPMKFDEHRVKKMYDGFLGRIQEIIDRDLVREMRVKGLQIEDERSVTNFLSCIGYIERLDLELENLEKLVESKTETYAGMKRNLSALTRRAIQYNRLLEVIKEDHSYSTTIQGFDEVTCGEKYGDAYFVLDGVGYRIRPTSMGMKPLFDLSSHLQENIRHITLSLWGKIVSGK